MISNRSKKLLIIGLTVFIVASIGGYLFKNKSEINEIISLSPYHLLAMVGITLIINLIYSEKLLLIYKHLGLNNISKHEWLKIFFMSRFLNLHLPQGGLAYRSFALKSQFGFTYSDSIGVATVYTLMETLTILIICTSALFYIHLQIEALPLPILVVSIIFIGLLLTGPFLLSLLPRLLRQRRFEWIKLRLETLSKGVSNALGDGNVLINLTVLNLLTVVLQCVWIKLSFLSLGIHDDPSYIFLYLITIQLSGLVRLIPGNWGVAELASGSLAYYLGDDFTSGVLISLTTRVAVYGAFLVIGLVFSLEHSFMKIRKHTKFD